MSKIKCKISLFPSLIYDLHLKKSRHLKMYVCVCVCLSVCRLSIICRAITRYSLHRSLWNFSLILKYVLWRSLLILAMIFRKLSFLGYILSFLPYSDQFLCLFEIFQDPMSNECLKHSSIYSVHQNLQFELL